MAVGPERGNSGLTTPPFSGTKERESTGPPWAGPRRYALVLSGLAWVPERRLYERRMLLTDSSALGDSIARCS